MLKKLRTKTSSLLQAVILSLALSPLFLSPAAISEVTKALPDSVQMDLSTTAYAYGPFGPFIGEWVYK